MSYTKIAFLTVSLLMTHLSYGADNVKPDIGLNSHKNPFTKNIPTSAMIITPPGGLPMAVNTSNPNMGLPTGSPKGLYGMDENASEQKTDWDNMKVVGFFNNYIILRIRNENNNSNVEPRTIFTDLNSKFFLNKNQYTIKANNKTFSIYNKNNQMVHKLSFGNNSMRLIPRSATNAGSTGNSNNGAAPATSTPTQQGANSGSGQ